MEYILNRMFAAVLAVTPWAVGLIAVLLWLRRAGGRKLSPRFFQLAFLILAVRLALPVDLSLPDAPVKAPMPAAIQQELEKMTFAIPEISVEQAVAPAIAQPIPETAPQDLEPQAAAPVKKSQKNLLPFLWFGGAILFLSAQLSMYAVFCIRLLRGRSPADEAIRELAEEQFGRSVRVYWMDGIASPMLAGLFRPAVYLPKDGVRTEDLPYVLAHEACHARRKDVPAQFLLLAAQAVHWFDPMVHWMARAARQDMERGCDEAVLAGQDLEYRRAYGSAVLSGLKIARRSRALTLSTGFSSGTDLKRRFKEMFDMNQKSKGLPLLAALAALVAVSSFLVSCGAAAQKASDEASSVAPAFVESTSDQPESEPASEQTSEPESKPASEAEPEKASAEEPQSDSRLQLAPLEEAMLQSAVPFVWPLEDGAEDCYVIRNMDSFHKGTDVAAPEGTKILAMHDGTVKTAQEHWSYGNVIEIEGSDGFSTLYAHCKELKVNVGDTVKAGDVIATVGMTGQSTGNHLHVEIKKDGELQQPKEYLEQAGMSEHVTKEEPVLQISELPQPETAFVQPLRKNNILVSNCMTERHKGADLVADEGDEILAMQSGTVKTAEFDSDKGNYVLIEGSDGFSTLYAHCKELKVNAGETVKAGDVIATVGMTGKSTGNHLHLEIRKGGECLQPLEYLRNVELVMPQEAQSGLAKNAPQRVACDE